MHAEPMLVWQANREAANEILQQTVLDSRQQPGVIEHKHGHVEDYLGGAFRASRFYHFNGFVAFAAMGKGLEAT